MVLKTGRWKKSGPRDAADGLKASQQKWLRGKRRWFVAAGLAVCMISLLVASRNFSAKQAGLTDADLTWPQSQRSVGGQNAEEFSLSEVEDGAQGAKDVPVFSTDTSLDGPRLLVFPTADSVKLEGAQRPSPLQDGVPVAVSGTELRVANHTEGPSDVSETGFEERPAVWLLGYIEEVGD